jgi:hypothetical protein
LIDKMIKKKTVILNQLSDDRAEMVGNSRFFNHKNVTWNKIFEEKSRDINQFCKDKHVLVINDTTDYNYFYHRNYLNLKDTKNTKIHKGGHRTLMTLIIMIC